MDWLMCIMMIILFAAVLVLLWKNYRIKKEAKLFAEKVEDALDAIVTGKEWNMEEELEDSLWGRTGTQLEKAGHVFRKKEEDGFREKERVKGLISDISHQTRTPIANIKLYLELLEDEEFSQSGQEFLRKIKGQMEKIDFLMQSMVKMSRLETGILQIHKEDKNLYETIRHAVAGVVPEAASKGIDLYVNCEENMMIRHDSKWTEEAIYNILDNALKYTEPGGSIQVEGVNLQALKGRALADYRGKKVGYLFQNFELLDNLTGRENILLPTSLHGIPEKESSQRLSQLAKYLEINDVLDKFPSKMSGGQRQRVAAARALILNPRMILADEPTGALDSKNARNIMEKLSGLNRDEQATILMVTHDSNAASFCKRILFIQDGVIFHELRRGDESRQEFYGRILKVMAQLGGGSSNVL